MPGAAGPQKAQPKQQGQIQAVNNRVVVNGLQMFYEWACVFLSREQMPVAHNRLRTPTAGASATDVPFNMSLMYHACSRTMGKRR